MISRRQLLQSIPWWPFLGVLKPSEASVEAKPTPKGETSGFVQHGDHRWTADDWVITATGGQGGCIVPESADCFRMDMTCYHTDEDLDWVITEEQAVRWEKKIRQDIADGKFKKL